MNRKHNNEYGISFKCQGSGNCCVSRGSYGFVYLTKKDINKLSKHFNSDSLKFKKKYCSKTDGFTHLKELKKNNGKCIFLKDKKCTVYKSRPIQCRTWPFWKENLKTKKWTKQIALFCPGIGKGKFYTHNQISKILNTDKKNDEKIYNENLSI